MNFRYLLAFLLLFASCSTTQKSFTPGHTEESKAYVQQYKDLAVREMQRTGIPASITLAQGILESDYGRSRLARQANNHFGIKCHDSWSGKRIYHDDDRRDECFRQYSSVYQSYRDHSRFLKGSQRYAFLFRYERTAYKKWARGLKKAGYATSPTYASRLIELIERYGLHRFDKNPRLASANAAMNVSTGRSSLGDVDNFTFSPGKHRIRTRNRIDYIVVKEGDTFKSLNKELNLIPGELKKYNELSDTASLYPGRILYLQPKRNKAARGFETHKVKKGDTMYSISQKYGIELEELYERNRMDPSEEPQRGDKIWLRGKKPREKASQ